jgi:hypothetical protein
MNGGLSLRRKSAMLNVLSHFEWDGKQNEDLFFCEKLKLLNANLPTFEVAKTFSVETIFGLGSLGYHAIEKYLTIEEQEQIKSQYDKV